ncbi:FmdB family transcriptional regulator [Massilia sp. Root351]|jgi:putative FmdB family regulatory protein|uniref:FmdB family zinc ribbon protein n=1 Tax=Massilia sp. Root351 TaxID=1736522 RepID=UPI0007107C18|nr:FmdB family zinc ribbon protein [Massilia sp. Root351]KQV79464.1 FmdB family transcriptional regulator [Massilia sp. Root351]
MPIYAYRCDDCGFAKDVLQKMSDPVLTDCPTCGKATFKKQLTAAGFQLKGTGWYATDFRGGTPPATGVATGPADAKPEGKPDAKSDSTAAAPAAAPASTTTSA